MAHGDASELCDATIVKSVCAELNQDTSELFGTASDTDLSVVHAGELAEQLGISKESVIHFLAKIQVANVETDADALKRSAFAVSCQELCKKAVGSIPKARLPPSADVGCYFESGETVCDLDLSPKAIDNITVPDEKPADRKKHLHPKSITNQQNAYKPLPPLSTTVDELKILVVEMFRIYPATEIKATLDPSNSALVSTLQLPPNFQKKVNAVGVKSKAYVSQALSRMNEKAAPQLVTKWFGNNKPATRTEIKRVLNGVISVLSNVEYKYPGAACDADTYAYVEAFPPENKNENGQYIVELCKLYLDSDLGTQIATLTHEAAHHLPMDVDDVKLNGETAYGKPLASELAASNSDGALDNADNYAFFLNEVQSLRAS